MNINKSKLQICGIYCIENSITKHCYIGSSQCIYTRLLHHLSDLRRNSHKNKHLQRAWNKYGEDSFDIKILESCDIDKKIEREQYYVDIMKPEYNIATEVVNLPPYDDKFKKRMSKLMKDKYANKEINISWAKEVYVYTLDGVFINKYSSIVEASKKLNISKIQLSKTLRGKQKRCHEYLLSYKPQDNLNKYVLTKKSKHVLLISILDNTIIKEFISAKECAMYLNKSRNAIYGCIRHKLVLNKMYMVKYKDAE